MKFCTEFFAGPANGKSNSTASRQHLNPTITKRKKASKLNFAILRDAVITFRELLISFSVHLHAGAKTSVNNGGKKRGRKDQREKLKTFSTLL